MDIWFYEYEVNYWEDAEEKTARGVVYGKNYAEAMQMIEGYYGDDIQMITKLYCCSEGIYEFGNVDSSF